MKAIETRYKGYRFRSRLEARWAVYFDSDGVQWEYEKEGYQLGDVFYLPDFWLPQVKMFAEVKPTEFTPAELTKCRELARASGYPVLLLDGPPDVRSYFAVEPPGQPWGEGYMDYFVGSCCDYHIDEGRFFCSTGAAWPHPTRGADAIGSVNEAAIHASRSARFEHGESGPRQGPRV